MTSVQVQLFSFQSRSQQCDGKVQKPLRIHTPGSLRAAGPGVWWWCTFSRSAGAAGPFWAGAPGLAGAALAVSAAAAAAALGG